MAQRLDDQDPVPPELAAYRGADWRGQTDPAAVWGEHVRAWLDANEPRGLPWNYDGDPVMVLCAVVRLHKLRLGGRPVELTAQDLSWLVAQKYNDVPVSWRPGGDGHAARR